MNFFRRTPRAVGAPEFLIVGLGNPGKEYEFTRHNAGFLCLDLFAQENDIKINRLKFNALIGDAEIGGKRCILAKPQTFMNNSGEAVRDIASFYKIPPEKIIVIFDDISLPCGRLRIRRKGTDGGHNGIKSIIYQLQSDQFPRIKLGIGAKLHPEQPLADWVLSVMKGDDLENLRSACLKACDAIPLLVNGETEKAMGLYNAAKYPRGDRVPLKSQILKFFIEDTSSIMPLTVFIAFAALFLTFFFAFLSELFEPIIIAPDTAAAAPPTARATMTFLAVDPD